MAASTPSEYIEHHLSFFTTRVGDGDFWSINVDTIVMSLIAGVIGLGFLWLATRKATSGVPSKHQAFVEMCVGFVNDQVKGIYHGDSKWVAPIAMTVGIWVLLMNSIDFLPIDIMSWFYENVLHLHKWRPVPTADINTTFALALTVSYLAPIFVAALSVPVLGERPARPIARSGRPDLKSLDELFAGADQRAKPFGKQGHVERFLERLIDRRAVEAERAAVVGQQGDQDRLAELAVATQILANLQRFELADREIDNDTVRVEAFGLNACFEATRSGRGAEGTLDWQLALHVLDQDLVLGDDEDFRHRFVFQVTKGHSMLLEELDQVFTRDASVLGTGDPVSLQAA